MSRGRAAELLPASEGHDRGLAFTIGVMAFLACLSIIGSLSADRAARGWTNDLSSGVTVQVRPGRGETGAEAAANGIAALKHKHVGVRPIQLYKGNVNQV